MLCIACLIPFLLAAAAALKLHNVELNSSMLRSELKSAREELQRVKSQASDASDARMAAKIVEQKAMEADRRILRLEEQLAQQERQLEEARNSSFNADASKVGLPGPATTTLGCYCAVTGMQGPRRVCFFTANGKRSKEEESGRGLRKRLAARRVDCWTWRSCACLCSELY